jgi:hypothetical protein
VLEDLRRPFDHLGSVSESGNGMFKYENQLGSMVRFLGP